ncbi:MAG: tetratricopeptide repeat protein [Paludibacteraceae bacterium]|nr:tetratricopeptide repeat protein [Paludibacteraceae bacterium]
MKRLVVSIIALLAFGLSFAQTNLDLAEQAIENGEYTLAAYYASEHLEANPKDASAYAMRSLAYAYQEEYVSAFADADKAIKFWNKKCEYDLPTLYCLRGLIHEQVLEYDKALADYAMAIKKDKKNPKGYSTRGRFYYKQSRYALAAEDYKKAHELVPENTEYTLEWARNLWLLDRNAEAAVILDELILYHPRLAEAKRIRALIYREAEDYQPFIDMYAEYMALERDKEDSFVRTAPKAFGYMIKTVSSYIKNADDDDARFFWLGVRTRVYLYMEQYTEALTDANAMQAIISDSVQNPYILLLKTDCYEGMYDFAQAVRCYNALIEMYPNNDYTYYYYNHRGRCYMDLGEYEKAEADYTKVIENDMDYAVTAYASRAYLKEIQKNYDGALEDYNKALMIDEDYAYVWMSRGRLYLKFKQDTIQATRDLNKVLELEGEDVTSTRVYALLYLGRTEEALALYDRIMADEPSAGNYYDLACIYSLLNRKEEAIRALTTAIEKGYKNFHHMEVDSDLDNIREMPEYIELMAKYRKVKMQGLFNKLPGSSQE